MMNLMNTADYANMAVMLAEDVCAPELRSGHDCRELVVRAAGIAEELINTRA